jgi:uncharacterized protein
VIGLEILPGEFAICQLAPTEETPAWIGAGFASVTRTATELSIVCAASGVPLEIKHERGWRVIQFRGTFAFTETGILASVLNPLAEAGIPILAISTFDTDYVLVKESDLAAAKAALRI